MKKYILLFFLCISTSTYSYSQEISCNDLYNYITSSYSPSTVNCFGSSFLVKVQRYDVEGSGFVVAHIKQYDFDYKGKPYIFCGISTSSWIYFKSEGMSGSWGEAFHKYIRDYTCNCY